MIYAVYILSKAGSLIYHKAFIPSAKQKGNDPLHSASVFNALHTMSKQVAPLEPAGIEIVETPTFTLHCFETATNMKFFATVDPGTPGVPLFLRKLYEFYADYALKNPFYDMGQPVRLKLFDYVVYKYAQDNRLVPTEGGGSGSRGGGGAMFTGSSVDGGAGR